MPAAARNNAAGIHATIPPRNDDSGSHATTLIFIINHFVINSF